MILTRRSFFGLLAAPAIIRIADLMPIKALRVPPPDLANWTIPMTPEEAVNFAPHIETYQQAVHSWLYESGPLPAAWLKDFKPGGDPAGWTPSRMYLKRGESALLVPADEA